MMYFFISIVSRGNRILLLTDDKKRVGRSFWCPTEVATFNAQLEYILQ